MYEIAGGLLFSLVSCRLSIESSFLFCASQPHVAFPVLIHQKDQRYG